MRTRIIWVAIAIALIVATLFGYAQVRSYLDHQAKAESALADAKKAVAQTTAATENSLNQELDVNSATTFGELFSRIDDRTKLIETAIVDIQASEIDANIRDASVSYLRSTQNLLRLQEQMYRKQLALSNEVDELKRETEDYRTSPYNEYSDQNDRRRIAKTREEALTANNDVKDSQVAFYRGLVDLRSLIERSATLKGFSLVNREMLAKVIAKTQH